MRNFKNPETGSIHAYDADQEHLIPDNYIEITDDAELEQAKADSYDRFINGLNINKQRQYAYPAIGDQLDALFHAGVFPDDMAAQIQAVKDKYPKG